MTNKWPCVYLIKLTDIHHFILTLFCQDSGAKLHTEYCLVRSKFRESAGWLLIKLAAGMDDGGEGGGFGRPDTERCTRVGPFQIWAGLVNK